MKKIEIYHGSSHIVSEPEIRIAKYHKDFYYGFYCTVIRNQALRWATRFGEAGYMGLLHQSSKNLGCNSPFF